MSKPKIAWFVRESGGTYTAKEEHHAGTYSKRNKLRVEMQVWNNRWGVDDTDSLVDPVLNFYFDTLEDSSLLHHCRVSVDDMGFVPLIIKGEKASARIGKTLSGRKNDGNDNLVANQRNFANIVFEFSAENYRLKENDLKNLFFELVSMD